MPPDELEEIRRLLNEALDFWVARGFGKELNHLQLSVLTYVPTEKKVQSRCQADLVAQRVGRNETLLTWRKGVT